MKKLLLAALALLAPALLPALAFGQSSPSLYNGQVPTASQWNGYFSSKQDYLGTVGTGVLLRQNGAVLVAPTLGVATGTSLKLGTLTLGTDVLGIAGTGASWGATTTSPGWYVALTGDTTARVRIGLNATDVPSLAFGPGNAARDAFIERVGAGALRFGAPDAAAPVSQVLSVQNVVAGTSNTTGADRYFDASQGTGTGLGGKHIFRVAPAGSSGTAQNALAAALTIDSTKQITGASDIVSAAGATSAGFINSTGIGLVGRGYIRNTSDGVFTFNNSGGTNSVSMTVGAAGGVTFGGAGVFGGSLLSSNVVQAGSTASFEIAGRARLFSPADAQLQLSNNAGTVGVTLVAEANNVLAQRNGTNAQTFNVYNTYTDASNYERGVFDWTTTASTLTIGTAKAGTGATRSMNLITGGGIRMQVNASDVLFSDNASPNADNTYDLGASGAQWRNAYVANIFFTKPHTVSGLGTCNAGNDGGRSYVTDATATTFASTVAGGASNHVPVYCDGSGTPAWKIGEIELPAANDNLDLYPGVEIHAAA